MRSVFRPLLDAQQRLHTIEQDMQNGDLSASEEYHQLSAWFENNDGYQIDVKLKTVLNGVGTAGRTSPHHFRVQRRRKDPSCHCQTSAGGTQSADPG